MLQQEVHCSEGTMDIWTCEWGYKALFSGCSSSKARVCILFNNNFNLQIHKVFSDPNGRFIICDIVAESKRLTVANIYAPNEDDPNFFHSFFDHLSSFRGEEIIIGDFNLVLDVEKDKRGGLARTHQKAWKVIQDFSEKLLVFKGARKINFLCCIQKCGYKETRRNIRTRNWLVRKTFRQCKLIIPYCCRKN